ncbi:ABC transporter ATP-binding protein [Chlamydia muridarum str. Nigg]|uniref:ABC transporter ATP-binding protein n=2 Tax=Chlamydia muridarum TaxID=83560 RepID=A0A069ZZ58_CHLMR|nr:ABC transporter ATP-binding protein [Chlamydia muridarum]UFT32405.1 ABC transporter ATP-binding protein [Chlamydia trachomatis]AAF73555.1 ABC transporter, ATP-binding protein [Chlamydia muridarum str. Nigg]AHH22837.1 ABC transporter ATP-binding protein [Chlamydia muridarum str. Nigg3 CMUT3-5]AHH23762.1 ABC transporter ATP-binding protein [Chlamydia muridarum str. Nigg CM972]AID37973.1 ABC transporter ATP-binding protein [Chlamydia muridarum str. Nigg 2 MCR]
MLVVKSLCYAHASHFVFEDAAASFAPGQISFILGGSGSGKTTLFRIIAGLLTSFIGEVLWNGQPVKQELVAYMQQKEALLPWRTVRKNILLPTELGPHKQKPLVQDHNFHKVIQSFGLSSLLDRFPDELSGGQRQRVVFAMQCLSPKPILLLDEPFTSLDSLTKEMLYQDVRRLAEEEGKAIILASHDVQDCLEIGETFFAIRNRKLHPISLDKQQGIAGLLQQIKNHLI